MEQSLGKNLHLWRVLELHMPSPSSNPHKKVEPCMHNFSGVSTFKRWGRGNCKSSWRRKDCFIKTHPEITGKYEYCDTVLRTLVGSNWSPKITVFPKCTTFSDLSMRRLFQSSTSSYLRLRAVPVILLQIVTVSPGNHLVNKSWVPLQNHWAPVKKNKS